MLREQSSAAQWSTWTGVEWIWEQIHSSPNYFRLSFFLVWLNTCLRRYSFALDPIRGDFGSSPSRSLLQLTQKGLHWRWRWTKCQASAQPVEDVPLCGNRFLHFSYMQASQVNLKALYRILIDVKPLVSAVARRQGCWRLIDVFDARILRWAAATWLGSP